MDTERRETTDIGHHPVMARPDPGQGIDVSNITVHIHVISDRDLERDSSMTKGRGNVTDIKIRNTNHIPDLVPGHQPHVINMLNVQDPPLC